MTACNRSLRQKLLVGASIAALSFTGAAQAQNFGGRRPIDPAAAAAQAAQNAGQRSAAAEAAAQRTRAAFEAASRARTQMDAAQVAAREAARVAQSSIPNGLGQGGLQVAADVEIDPSLWVGANGPTQSQGENGRTNVTVEQTQEKAILTWDSFNVGRETDLRFDQQGNADWVALNRVTSGSVDPTQILGSIKADGSVYVINPNGVIFGGASQVNVRTLIASSLDIAGATRQERDQRFMEGLFGNNQQDPAYGGFNGLGTFSDGVTNLSSDELRAELADAANSTAPGVTVEAGALIETTSNGSVVLVGRNVDNAGTLISPDGQVLLAAGRNVLLLDGTLRSEGLTENATNAQGQNLFKIPGFIALTKQGGRASNSGVIESTRGTIGLSGAAVLQNGLLSATTSVDKAGSIILDAGTMQGFGSTFSLPSGYVDPVGGGPYYAWHGSVLLGEGSHISILPEESDRTAVGASFVQSQIEIVGNQIVFGKDSTLWAPAANLRVIADGVTATNSTPGRIYLDAGATIDVSGLNGVEIAMEQNSVKAELRANELADNPVVRDGPLRGETVYFDGRLGERLTDGTGVADLSGWYDLIGRTADQFMTTGGSVLLSGAEIITREGSTIDISGGSVRYNDGVVKRTKLIDPHGRLVPIEEAVAGVNYVGVEGDFIVDHSRWGVTERFQNTFARTGGGDWQQGYDEGRSAGKLTIQGRARTDGSTLNVDGVSYGSDLARIFEGEVKAGVLVGDYQKDAPSGAGVTDMTRIWHERPSLGTLNFSEASQQFNGKFVYGGDITIADQEARLGDDFTASTQLFDKSDNMASSVEGVTVSTHVLPAEWFDGETFGTVNLFSGDAVNNLYQEVDGQWVLKPDAPLASPGGVLTIAQGVTVDLGDYGSFNFVGRQANVDGTIVAPGGKVSLEGTWLPKLGGIAAPAFDSIPEELRPGVTLGATGRIDVAGRWTNAYDDTLKGQALMLPVVDGGKVTLYGYRIDLAEGSVIDASGGAHLGADGQTLTLGNGGSITLDIDTSDSIGLQPGGDLVMDGDLIGHAPGKGGTLSLYTPWDVVITDEPGGLAAITDGVLEGGTAAPKELTLSEALVVRAGDPLPVDVAYSSNQIPPDVPIAADGTLYFYDAADPIVLAADWVVPAGLYEVYTPDFGQSFMPGQTVPAGTQLGYIYGGISAGTVFPSSIFPNGVRSQYAVSLTAPRGSVMDSDLTVPVGTKLPKGTTLAQDAAVFAPKVFTTDHFHQGGFANFTVSGAQGLTVTSGTVIQPKVDTLVLTGAVRDIASGARLTDLAAVSGSGVTLVNSDELPEWRQQTTDLVLSTFRTERRSGWAQPVSPVPNSGTLTVEEGAEIRLAAEARVTLNANGRLFVDGLIETAGGDIFIQGNEPQINSGNLSILIGDNARLLARGYEAVVDNVDGHDVRAVADGGTITIGTLTSTSGGTRQRVLIGEGALLDVSGVAGIADLLPGSAGGIAPRAGSPYVATQVDGAGGTIRITPNSGMVAGELRLAAGGDSGLGGRLELGTPGAMVIRETIDDLGPVTADSVVPTDAFTISAARLDAAGAGDLVLGGGGQQSTSITFDGDVRLSAGRSVLLEATSFGARAGATVEIEAAYVRLGNGGAIAATSPASSIAEGSALTVRADTIDLLNNVLLVCADCGGAAGFATADFIAEGDIRLVGDRRTSSLGSGGPAGSLVSPGAITLESAQTYVTPFAGPISDVDYVQYDRAENDPGFLVRSDVSITVRSNGNAAPVPLTWGGKLTLRAPEITQAGVLRAPLGVIALEASDRLTLAPGSLTSVSLEGNTALAGLMSGLLTFTGYHREDWAPSKAVVLSGDNVDLQDGAVVDLSGGGDLIGYTFTSGAGGTRNLLADPGTFAILPGYQGALPIGASVPGGTPGWGGINVGDQVWLEGVPGLAAGYYTLLPATYGLLDGAMLVRPMAGGATAGRNTVQQLDDGSTMVSGYRAVAGTDIRPDQGWTSFQVMNSKTWQRYSDITTYSFNEMRAKSNAETGYAVRTPADAGRLVIDAHESLALLGEAKLGGALAGDVDISNSGGGIALVGAGEAAPEGYLSVDATTVQAFAGDGSLLIGGRRTITTRVPGDDVTTADSAPGGLALATTATDVLIAEGVSYEGLELLLAATESITIGEGAQLTASGSGAVNGSDLLLSGDGTLVRLSRGERVGIARSGGSGTHGVLTIGSGAALISVGALSLDASGGFDLAADAVLDVAQLDLASDRILIGEAPEDTVGTVLSLDTIERLAGASDLLLRGHQAIAFYGDVTIGGRDGSGAATLAALTLDTAVIEGHADAGEGLTLTAGTLTLKNSGAAAAETPDAGTGTLGLDVDRLVLAGGSTLVGGYAGVEGSIGELRGEGQGGLVVAGDADLAVGRATVASRAASGLTASGALALRQGEAPAGTLADADEDIGGKLTFTGGSLSFDTQAVSRGGTIALAATEGDLALGASARIDVTGVAKDFIDVTRYAPGGVVRLSAAGDVTGAEGSVIDVSGHERGGNAGVLEVAAGGRVALDGQLLANSHEGYAGGEAAIDAGSADFTALNARLNAGKFSASRDIRLDEAITLAVGETIEAHRVSLRSDNGDVTIAGTIAANGDATTPDGGKVTLTGRNVTLAGTGRIEAAAAAVGEEDFPASSGSVMLAADEGRVVLASGSTVDLTGGREGGGRIMVRAARTANGADAELSGTVTGARERVLVGSAVYGADTIDAALVTTVVNEANSWRGGASAPTGWDVGAGIVFRSADDLTVASEIDLSRIAGPGWLGLEAGGDLLIEANISDGFSDATANATLDSGSSFSYGFEAGRDISMGDFAPPLEFVTIAGGQAFDIDRPMTVPLTPAADWVVPPGLQLYNAGFTRIYVEGDVVPRGETIAYAFGPGFGNPYWPAGYVLPADAFPAGFAYPPIATPYDGPRYMVRTGTGDISLAAGRDIKIGQDSVVYTAGRATPTEAGFDRAGYVSQRTNTADRVLGEFATQGGDIDVDAGRDVRMAIVAQTPTAWLFRYGEATWNGEPDDTTIQRQTSWSIVHRNFQYGLGTLGGGDIAVRAGRDTIDLAAALPTTGHLTTPVGGKARDADLVVRGGGNLTVRALGDIAGGAFVLGRGEAKLVAAGDVRDGITTKVYESGDFSFSPVYAYRGLGPIFGLMDAAVDIVAAGEVTIEGAYDPMLVPQICENIVGSCTAFDAIRTTWFSHSGRSALNASAAGGDIVFRANALPVTVGSALNANAALRVNPVNNHKEPLRRMPGTVKLASLNGDLVIQPPASLPPVLSAAPNGTLELLAAGSVVFDRIGSGGGGEPGWGFRLDDTGLEYIRDALAPASGAGIGIPGGGGNVGNNNLRGYDLLHAEDGEPVRIYALGGSIGISDETNVYNNWSLVSPKPVHIQAAGDISPAGFILTHDDPNDISVVIAGGDIQRRSGEYVIYGPGTLWVEAGGSILVPAGSGTFRSVGNGAAVMDTSLVNYALADVGADINLVAGTAQGADFAAFADLYLDPANLADPAFGLSHPSNQGKVVHTYEKELDELLAAKGFTEVTAENRRELFDSLPEQTRQGFLQQVLLRELQQTGIDYNDAEGPRFQQYTRGYAALHLLYPGTEGLNRDNPLGGDIILNNAAVSSISGGALNLIAPYGRVAIGDPVRAPNRFDTTAGIITRRGGDINILANGTISLEQSRVFTMQGGDILMWTSQGDITAGVGAKTSVSNVPITYVMDADGRLAINVFGLQTGAGIGVLDAFEGRVENRRKSRLDLLAFFGEVNAGDAGIRVVGDLNIAALRVVNAANIEVSGEAVGIPEVPAVNVGALTAASSATSAIVNEAAQLAERSRPQVRSDIPSIITGRLLGFGE